MTISAASLNDAGASQAEALADASFAALLAQRNAARQQGNAAVALIQAAAQVARPSGQSTPTHGGSLDATA